MQWYLENKVAQDDSEKREELLQGITTTKQLIDNLLKFSTYKDESFKNQILEQPAKTRSRKASLIDIKKYSRKIKEQSENHENLENNKDNTESDSEESEDP